MSAGESSRSDRLASGAQTRPPSGCSGRGGCEAAEAVVPEAFSSAAAGQVEGAPRRETL